MASSGSFSTNYCTPSSRTWYWDFSWWVSSWSGNTATISWSCTARCTSGTSGTTWIGNYGFGGSIAGNGIGNPGGNFVKDTWGTSGSFTLGGGTTFSADIWAHPYNSSSTSSGSGQWTLDNNVVTPSVSISLSAATETTIAASMSVTHDGYQPIKDNYIDLFTDSGCTNKVGTINGTSGTFTGLNANTTYYARANASNGYYRGYSGVSSKTTYRYPYLISASDFVIGNNVTLRIYNPLNRTVELQMWSHNNQMFINPTKISATPKDNTDYTFPASNYTSNLYASIPATTESRYNIDVWYNENKAIGDLGKKYKVSGNNAQAPTFSNFTYEDTNATTKALTGNNQILVSGMSTCKFTIATDNKASSSYGATLDKYNFAWPNAAGTSAAFSSNAAVSSSISNGNTNRISVTAYDKRSQYKTVSKTVTLITPSKAGNTSLNTVRQNGVNATVFLAGAFKLWAGDWAGGSSRPNTLRKVEYTVNGGSNYYDITSAVTNNSSSSTSNNIKTITLNSNTIQLHANGSSGGFAVGTAYTVRIYVTTGVNDSTIYESRTLVATIVITAGIFGMARYKDSNGKYHYGFDGMPASDKTMKVHGNFEVTDELWIRTVLKQSGMLRNRRYIVKKILKLIYSIKNLPEREINKDLGWSVSYVSSSERLEVGRNIISSLSPRGVLWRNLKLQEQ